MRKLRRFLMLGLAPLPLAASGAFAQLSVQPDATVRLPTYRIPFSSFASAQARAAFSRKQVSPDPVPPTPTLAEMRARVERDLTPDLAKMRKRFRVVTRPARIGGVPVEIIEPANFRSNNTPILINLHGGGFEAGAGIAGRIDSFPIAAILQLRVVSVDYRQGPENRFPAASEDVASVYRALLKRHPAGRIGIFGSSAGGLLTAESVSWFQRHKLPRPGAIAMLSASAFGWMGGDSSRMGQLLIGDDPGQDLRPFALTDLAYFQGTDPRDSLVTPALDDRVLSAFPPTLIVVGTRDFAFSGAIETQRRLDALGVPVQFAGWDGLGHFFYSDPDLPESREVYERVARFFARWLAPQHRTRH